MNKLDNQSGYSLLITIVLIILFSILGLSMLALTSSGIQKNEVRQDTVRSADLSDKGIDYLSKQINSDLTIKLGSNGLPRGKFIEELEKTLNSYLCPPSHQSADEKNRTTNSIKGQTGKTDVCIKSYIDSKDDKGVDNPLRKLVTFNSIGVSGTALRNLNSEVEIGAELVPETLKYAIGTNIVNKNSPQNGEGNLLMHGGVTIQGDMKVDGNILTRDYGYAYLSGEQWIPSIFPESLPSVGSTSSKLVLGGKSYLLKTTNYNKNNILSYNNHINKVSFSDEKYYSQEEIRSLFRENKSPTIVQRIPIVSPIPISQVENNYKLTTGDYLSTGESAVISNEKKPSSKVIPKYTYSYTVTNGKCLESKWGNCKEYEKVYTPLESENTTFTLKGNNSFKQLSTIGNLKILESDSTFEKGLYVGGDLTIGNSSTSEDPSNYANITIQGPIYVKGNVTIKGANLKTEVLLYVEGNVNGNYNGNVDIQYSTINGKPLTDGTNGSLVIFSKGQVKIANNSVNQDTPSKIKGFFYSEKDLEIFGVGSNIRIEGGISARRIVLNAIRGRAKDKDKNGNEYKQINSPTIINKTDYFEGVDEQNKRNSRLQIIYDPQIISTYSDLKQQEPIIFKVDPPVQKNRVIK